MTKEKSPGELPVLPIELPPEDSDDEGKEPIMEIRNTEMLQLLRRSQSMRRRSSLAEVIPDYTPQEQLRLQTKTAFRLKEVMCYGECCSGRGWEGMGDADGLFIIIYISVCVVGIA